MRKLTQEERAKLEGLVNKLDVLDPNSSDAKAIKEELVEITNEFAEVSNKAQKEVIRQKSAKPNKKIIDKENHEEETKAQVIQKVKNKVGKRQLEIKELDEEELLDINTYMELIKSIIELNQKCIDYSLVALENANDIQCRRIKKCIDANTENKRKLKSILKECINTL